MKHRFVSWPLIAFGLLAVSAVSADVGRHVLVANSGDGTLSTYAIDDATQLLRHRGYYVAGTTPVSIAVTSDQAFAYVVDSESRIHGFRVLTNGHLLPVPGSPLMLTGGLELADAVATQGFLYATSARKDIVLAFRIATDGRLTPLSAGPWPTGSNPGQIAAHPTNSSLYVLNRASNTVTIYAINSGGALTVLGSVATGRVPAGILAHPNGAFVFVANSGTANVSLFRVQINRGLTPAAESPFTVGAGPTALALHPDGAHLFVANTAAGSITQMRLASGRLNRVTDFGGFPGISAVDIEPDGDFLFAALKDLDTVRVDRVNVSLATLQSRGQIRTRVAPAALALLRGAQPVTFDPVSLHILEDRGEDVDAIHQYRLDDIGRVTTPAASVSFLSANAASPARWSVHVSGRRAFMQQGGATTHVLDVDETSGTVVENPALAVVTSPDAQFDAQLDPSGRFFYLPVLSGANGCRISLYRVSATNGALTPDALAAATPQQCTNLRMDPTGQFLYVLPGTDRLLRGFEIDAASGALTLISQFMQLPATVPPVRDLIVEPSGRFLYLVTDGFRIFTVGINQRSGLLAPNFNQPFSITAADQRNRLRVLPDTVGLSLTTQESSGQLSTLSILSSGLLFARQINFLTLESAHPPAMHPAGHSVYFPQVIDGQPRVTRLRRDVLTGALILPEQTVLEEDGVVHGATSIGSAR